MSSSDNAQTVDENVRKAQEVAKRISQSQDFRSLGDQLSGHEASMIATGIKAAQTKAAGEPPAAGGAGPGPAPVTRTVTPIRDAEGKILRYEVSQ